MLDEFEIALFHIISPTFPRQSQIIMKNKAKDSTKILSQIHKEMKRRYQGRWDKHMMADFCWMLMREHVMKGWKR